MAIVVIPNLYLSRIQEELHSAEVNVSAGTAEDIYRELADRFPEVRGLLIDDDRNPKYSYALYRETDEDDCRYHPDAVYGPDDKLFLVSMVAS